jgi:hypothetical protein
MMDGSIHGGIHYAGDRYFHDPHTVVWSPKMVGYAIHSVSLGPARN